MELTPDQVDDLQQLINYNWQDERQDWENHRAEDNGTHIFLAMRRLQKAIEESGHQP